MKCRYCASQALLPLGGLQEMSICGVFPGTADAVLPRVRMELRHCSVCGLTQLAETGVSLADQYGQNYGYRSGLNGSMVRHLKLLASYELAASRLTADSVVIEVGANDGTHLREFANTGARLIAVDPTLEKWRQYYDFPHVGIADFFPCPELEGCRGRADLVISHACFYDLPDVAQFVKAVSESLKHGGLWSFEQIYLPSMIANRAFDSICDEHLEYYDLRFIQRALHDHGLFLESATFNEANGGSIWVVARKGYSNAFDGAFDALVEMERRYMGRTPQDVQATFQQFFADVERLGQEVTALVKEARDHGPLYVVGASTKGNALLQHWQLGRLIDGCLEINPDKFGRFTPGTDVPIVDERQVNLAEASVLILPWHFGKAIEQRYAHACKRVIVPLPRPHVLLH